MYKISPLNKEIPKSAIVINEETVSLGNSRNTSTIFRKHKFTVIRPNLIGFAHNDLSTEEFSRESKDGKNKAKSMLNSFKSKFKDNSTQVGRFIDINLIPSYVLINPSQWGNIMKKNKDGSIHELSVNNDALISVRKIIGYHIDNTISVQFNLKVSNVE